MHIFGMSPRKFCSSYIHQIFVLAIIIYPSSYYAACHGPTLSRGLLWPVTAVNDTAMLQCSEINPSTFRFGPYATRKCLRSSNSDEGIWDEVDITNCTTRSDLSLVVYSTYLLSNSSNDITARITEITNEVYITYHE